MSLNTQRLIYIGAVFVVCWWLSPAWPFFIGWIGGAFAMGGVWIDTILRGEIEWKP
jgi:hypothetical protein